MTQLRSMDSASAGVVGGTPAEVASALRSWLDEHADSVAPFATRPAESLDDEVHREAVFQQMLWDAGWLRLGWPVECGGSGWAPLLRAAVYEQLWQCGFPVPEGLQGVEVILPMMSRYAPGIVAARGDRYLSGAEVWCQGFSEPEAGSDLASLRTTARAEGEEFVVRGHKIWISLGTVASHCLLLARTGGPGPRGLSFLFVDLASEGVTVSPIVASNGRAEFAEILFDDVRVPKEALVGELGGGWLMAMDMLQWERSMYAWQRYGCLTHRVVEAVRAVDPERLAQLSGPLTQAFTAIQAVRCRSKRTIERLDSGESPGAETSVDKVLLAAAEHATFEFLRQAHFPHFHMDPGSHYERFRAEYFYSRSSSVYGGAREVQKNIIAERLLGLPRERG